ncbi:glycosyltransferase family 1 protein [Mycobacterium sp. PS03-16]|uniref:glycosyltransferase family 4 protein n=1 Tax=Mycobacterium sp. PS03-16 TaxID=2559611 RepID=UPI00107454F5|nr:glycosyltransferase family 4 protein [Mycobacterium sp. PS03-16]TFV59924.1 glycosyltransferase family 1 protein [Mycobacterium sp. PS03-16]
MIRVLAVTDAAEVCGTEHSLLNLAEKLLSADVEMTLAARGGRSLEQRWRALGLPFQVVALPSRRGFRPSTGKGYHGITELSRLPYRTLLAVRRIIRTTWVVRPEIIHSSCLMTHFDCAAAGMITRTPSVLELHDIVAPGVGRLMMGVAVRLSGRAIAVSSAVKNQLPRWARSRVVVIPQGIDTDRFDVDDGPGQWRRQLTSEPDCTLVAAIGRIDPEKNLHVLIRAVAIAREAGANLHLALVGAPSKDNGTYREELKALGQELLPGAFRMLPQVEDVPGVLRSTDVLVCPSVEEPFGLILLEAQACRVPVVASAAGGPREFIAHGRTGMLVLSNDPLGYADALQRLVHDPRLREQIAREGRARVRTSYSAEARAQKVMSLYRQIGAGREATAIRMGAT